MLFIQLILCFQLSFYSDSCLHVKGNFLCFQLFVIDNLIKFLLHIFFYSLYLYLNKTEHRKRERIYYPLESCTKLHQQFLLNCKLSWKVFILFLFLYVFLVCLFVCVVSAQECVCVCEYRKGHYVMHLSNRI